MGTSFYCKVCYGIVIYNDYNWEYNDEMCTHYLELENEGLEDTYEPYLPELMYYIEDQFPNISIESYGYESNAFVLCIKESLVEANIYDIKEFAPTSLDTKPDWNEILEDFCEKSGFTYKQPKWLFGGQIC